MSSIPPRRGKPQFVVLERPADRAADLPDALNRIFRREVDALILRGLMSREEMAEVATVLQQSDDHFPRTASEDPDLSVRQVYVLGVSMTPSRIAGAEPDTQSYLDAVEPFTAACRALFPVGDGFLERTHLALEALAGGRPVSVFRSSEGRTYTPATIRIVPPGCEIPTHSGLEFLKLGGYADLIENLDCSEQLSFFSIIDPPEDGGELMVYRADHFDSSIPRDEQGDVLRHIIDEEADYEVFSLQPGDLLLFAGGRWFHRVTPVLGARARRSIGGFLGFSTDGGRVYYWS